MLAEDGDIRPVKGDGRSGRPSEARSSGHVSRQGRDKAAISNLLQRRELRMHLHHIHAGQATTLQCCRVCADRHISSISKHSRSIRGLCFAASQQDVWCWVKSAPWSCQVCQATNNQLCSEPCVSRHPDALAPSSCDDASVIRLLDDKC